jgi:hypothetical protein
MLNRLKKYRLDLAGSIFNADKAYDGERNFESLFGICVLPNIKQRTNAKKGKNRKKAAKIFNASIYHYRGLIEGIFGAEENKHHQLYCRFRLKNNQKRFGLIKSIAWNLQVTKQIAMCKQTKTKAHTICDTGLGKNPTIPKFFYNAVSGNIMCQMIRKK